MQPVTDADRLFWMVMTHQGVAKRQVTRMAEATSDLKRCKQDLDEARAKISEQAENMTMLVDCINDMYASHTTQANEKEMETTQLRDQVSMMTSEVRGVKSQLTEAHMTANRLEGQVSMLTAELNATKAQVTAKANETHRLQEEMAVMTAELSTTKLKLLEVSASRETKVVRDDKSLGLMCIVGGLAKGWLTIFSWMILMVLAATLKVKVWTQRLMECARRGGDDKSQLSERVVDTSKVSKPGFGGLCLLRSPWLVVGVVLLSSFCFTTLDLSTNDDTLKSHPTGIDDSWMKWPNVTSSSSEPLARSSDDVLLVDDTRIGLLKRGDDSMAVDGADIGSHRVSVLLGDAMATEKTGVSVVEEMITLATSDGFPVGKDPRRPTVDAKAWLDDGASRPDSIASLSGEKTTQSDGSVLDRLGRIVATMVGVAATTAGHVLKLWVGYGVVSSLFQLYSNHL